MVFTDRHARPNNGRQPGACAFCFLLLWSIWIASAAPAQLRVGYADPLLQEKARALPVNDWLIVESLPLAEVSGPTDLVLERFEVFAIDARIALRDGLDETLLAPPRNAYFKGYLAGEPRSLALLTVLPDDTMRGLIGSRGRLWVLASGARARGPAFGLASREIDVAHELDPLARGWSCAAGDLDSALPLLERLVSPAAAETTATPSGASHTARIAIETDHEFFSRAGGNTTDVLDYIGDLIAYGSALYSVEVETSWLIETVFLYTNSSDPWQQSSPVCGLYEFGRYWNDNRSAIDRTIAHFMSGKNNGGGVAWRGVLCSGPFNVNIGSSCPGLAPTLDNYGGAYGYSGSMSGSFDIDNPTVVWDMVVVTHEIGHNFNSKHTHDYCNVGGNPNPVDECVPAPYGPACNGESGNLPPGCSAGQGCGTLMSYCHLISGGMGNIAPTLGLGHPWGVEPDRVPAVMRDHVQSRAAANPGCLDLVIPALIFADDFESGGLAGWSEELP